jgi:CBS-domain-containing membrane protein
MPASFGAGEDYVKSHASRVADVMTAKVITATPDTHLNEIVESLRERRQQACRS